MNSHPFSALTPEIILNAVESLGIRCDGRLLALNSFENRVYQVGIEDAQPLIAKFYRPERWQDAAIIEEHSYLAELVDAEIPVVAAIEFCGRTLHHFENFRFALFPRRGGRAPELDREGTLEWIGRFIGRIHAVGAVCDFESRPALDIESFGFEPRKYLLANDFIPADLIDAYRSVSQQALDGVSAAFDRAGKYRPIRLHGDIHLGNMLWTDDGPHFVDFDDSRMGPAIQDLWMLLSGERRQMSSQLAEVLAGYEDFYEFDSRELYLIEALRTLRLIHYSAWIARRWQDPAFPAAFPWFNTQRYWQDRILELREQVAALEEPPLWPA